MESESKYQVVKSLAKESKYEVIKSLNSGTFAKVDLGIDKESGNFVALKRISKESDEVSEDKDFPKLEIAIHKKLNHDNVIKLLDHYETEEEFVLVLEYGGPSDLFDFIYKNSSLDDESCKRIFLQVLNAVEYCHSQGIYHRDIKPENIVIFKDQIKLCDFGLATSDPISRDFGYGSVSYMAPEVFGDYKWIDGYFSSSADVWALGVLLFNMKFGILPWNEASKSDVYFQSFLKNINSFKKSFNLSDDFVLLLKGVFDINPFTRCSIKKLRVLVNNLKEFCKNSKEVYPKRRLSLESLKISDRKKKEWVKSWAEEDGDMDFSKPLQFGDESMPIACGLTAHVRKTNRALLNEMY